MTINNVSSFHHVAMTVRDGAKSAQWYHQVFGFELVEKFTRTWLVGRGSCNLGLTELPKGHPVEELNAKIAIQHIAFHVEPDDFASAVQALKDLAIPFEGPDESGVAGPSVFFQDPDGHELEITAYQGKAVDGQRISH
jgi:catechol 2,3-dioxygenase-like lactoylglutathione lyase family enzyme